MKTSSTSSTSAAATHSEAATTSVQHTGPTADRYAAALESYLEAVAGDTSSPGATAKNGGFPPFGVGEVMTRTVVSAYPGAPFKKIARALVRNRIHAVPVLDERRRVIGVVSASDLLARVTGARTVPRGRRRAARAEDRRKQHAANAQELMTHPAVTVRTSTPIAEAARAMARARVRSLPVVDRDGTLVGTVSRADLITLFLRPDEDIRQDIVRDVVQASTVRGREKVVVLVDEGVVTLSGWVESALVARGLVYGASQVAGVVNVPGRFGVRHQ
jgi:CBS domain-containing protein